MRRSRVKDSFQVLLKVVFLLLLMLLMANVLCALPVTNVSKNAIKTIIVDYINNNMPWPKGSVRINFFPQISGITLPAKDIIYRVISMRDEDFIGYSNFTIRFYSENVFLGEKTVRVKIEVLRNMVVSTRYLARGTNISKDDVKVVKRWFDRVSPEVITDINDVLGKRLCTTIRQPNAVITRNMLRKPVMIKRGKLVRIVLEKGPLTITTIGLSEQDGSQGDIIRVKNIASKNIIYARVKAPSLVQVDF